MTDPTPNRPLTLAEQLAAGAAATPAQPAQRRGRSVRKPRRTAGAFRPATVAEVQDTSEDHARLAEQLAAAERRAQTAEEALVEARTRVAALTEQSSLVSAVPAPQTDERASVMLTEAAHALSDARRALSTHQATITALTRDLDQAKEFARQEHEAAAQARSRHLALTAQVNALTAEHNQLTAQLAAAGTAAGDARAQAAGLSEQMQALNARLVALTAERDQLNARLAEHNTDRGQADELITQLNAERSRAHTLAEQVLDLTTRANALTAERERLTEKLSMAQRDNRDALAQAQGRAELASGQLSSERERAAMLERQLDAIQIASTPDEATGRRQRDLVCALSDTRELAAVRAEQLTLSRTVVLDKPTPVPEMDPVTMVLGPVPAALAATAVPAPAEVLEPAELGQAPLPSARHKRLRVASVAGAAIVLVACIASVGLLGRAQTPSVAQAATSSPTPSVSATATPTPTPEPEPTEPVAAAEEPAPVEEQAEPQAAAAQPADKSAAVDPQPAAQQPASVPDSEPAAQAEAQVAGSVTAMSVSVQGCGGQLAVQVTVTTSGPVDVTPSVTVSGQGVSVGSANVNGSQSFSGTASGLSGTVSWSASAGAITRSGSITLPDACP